MERNNTNSTSRDGLLLRFESRSTATASPDFVLQWGNKKRLRCMKVQAKDHSNTPSGTGPVQRTTARVDRRVVRSDLNGTISSSREANSNQLNNINAGKSNGDNGYINLRQRPASPSHRLLSPPRLRRGLSNIEPLYYSPCLRGNRNSENTLGMRGHSNGLKGLASPDRDCKKSSAAAGNNIYHHHHNKNSYHNDPHGGGGGGSGSSEATHDGKKSGLSGSGDAIAAVWLPKFVIALTNKEKEEDFLAIKGSKLPQRPKKRAKFIQRTLNLVCPGAWLSDLTMERYEVREKKVSKKRPRGLKAMGNMDSDSDS
ncbi:uncharacterized protein LOC127265737 isoform X1 [Andrographis paniculata]|uniref:uncharacterized protein LOC127265737 isoform X1 n=1 Tax=Andrographis paniculata TaxID=175694 RepID=UPI0021E9859A|nr:uncharacterized protein LOC127265737 isoform X1 [Andrographis paniculata]XP_051151661.1 uncharacterized protein LOC127265737 isoform X1 [Andrographis paniculata]XP_051151662.1 uncharacterized protein LOC127265737 isoform X1 [Andrographis paniculata]XP_051151663.1 uncharacterized protein LOC127265737 isoform X1 [Andrographis paniculata]XP_051151664.1 uncharacterized protein LOC127265737 isoform X1 [Andrographis paniculata]XP_051151665.1 uncharacterized protein LOC127265737 isoform X1 [Androg